MSSEVSLQPSTKEGRKSEWEPVGAERSSGGERPELRPRKVGLNIGLEGLEGLEGLRWLTGWKWLKLLNCLRRLSHYGRLGRG